MSDSRPIGIFDSGLGGISVVKAVMDILPPEPVVYFGDTARLPYGSKSPETVQRFSAQISAFLLEKNVKMIVVACNTASAVALKHLQSRFDIPIIGVIEPGAAAALHRPETLRVGVIGTTSTIGSGAYTRALKAINKNLNIQTQSCPLLVPLIEEGWQDIQIINAILRTYLHDFIANPPQSLILGCTHYPYLKNEIQNLLGSDVLLVDSGNATADVVKTILTRQEMLNHESGDLGMHQFYVSDFPQKFAEISERFLGKPLENLFRVELEVLESYLA